jgi:hypothetical protein
MPNQSRSRLYPSSKKASRPTGAAPGSGRRRVRRAAVLAVAAASTLGVGGCGSSSGSATPAKVTVRVLAPVDGSRVRADHLVVRGTVTPPDATVQVRGQSAEVGDGVFTASVALHRGANAIDVVASASGAAPASASVSVTRPAAATVKSAPVITHTTTVIEAPATSVSAPASSAGDWPGPSAYTVVLGSMSTETAARAVQARATAAGLDAGVLYSSDFSSLRAGYWVVFSGVFDTHGGTAGRVARAHDLGFSDAYPRFVSR